MVPVGERGREGGSKREGEKEGKSKQVPARDGRVFIYSTGTVSKPNSHITITCPLPRVAYPRVLILVITYGHYNLPKHTSTASTRQDQ